MIYWWLIKRNNRSVQEIIYNIITCNPEPQANCLEWCPVHERIILLNRFFLVSYLNKFNKLDWSIWISSWLEQLRSTSYSIQTHFWTPDSQSDWKWAEITAYMIQWWMNWFSTPVPSTVTELRKQFRLYNNNTIAALITQLRICYVIAWLRKLTSELNQYTETNCPKEPVCRK